MGIMGAPFFLGAWRRRYVFEKTAPTKRLQTRYRCAAAAWMQVTNRDERINKYEDVRVSRNEAGVRQICRRRRGKVGCGQRYAGGRPYLVFAARGPLASTIRAEPFPAPSPPDHLRCSSLSSPLTLLHEFQSPDIVIAGEPDILHCHHKFILRVQPGFSSTHTTTSTTALRCIPRYPYTPHFLRCCRCTHEQISSQRNAI